MRKLLGSFVLVFLVSAFASDSHIEWKGLMPTDHLTGAVVWVDLPHFKGHSCERFIYRDSITLGETESTYFSMTVPDGTYEYHIDVHVSANGSSLIHPIIKADSAKSGTLMKSYPTKPTCTDSGLLVIRKGATVYGGSLIWPEVFGNAGSPSGVGRFGGETTGRSEVVAEPGEVLGFKLRSFSATNKHTVIIDYYIEEE